MCALFRILTKCSSEYQRIPKISQEKSQDSMDRLSHILPSLAELYFLFMIGCPHAGVKDIIQRYFRDIYHISSQLNIPAWRDLIWINDALANNFAIKQKITK